LKQNSAQPVGRINDSVIRHFSFLIRGQCNGVIPETRWTCCFLFNQLSTCVAINPWSSFNAHRLGQPPKTVSQILGEITWLMTQSPRHKAIPLGDIEWLLMPAILLRQFRIFYKGEQPVGVAVSALAMRSWRSGSMRGTSG
jgi:RTX toxin acyltransferase family